jgi:hypothetical protein
MPSSSGFSPTASAMPICPITSPPFPAAPPPDDRARNNDPPTSPPRSGAAA